MGHKKLEVILKMKPYRILNIQSAISSRQILKIKNNWVAVTTTTYTQ